MADWLDFCAEIGQQGSMADIILPSREQFLREDAIRVGMDLLFFANTRHLKRADELLAAQGLGRADLRLMYFLARRPGIHVAALLRVLDITKQSFARVAHGLTTRGLIEQRREERDRRKRLLQLTPAGIELEKTIFEILHDNIAHAYAASGGEAVAGFWTVLQYLIGEEGRVQFRAVQGDRDRSDPR